VTDFFLFQKHGGSWQLQEERALRERERERERERKLREQAASQSGDCVCNSIVRRGKQKDLEFQDS
jgi:hypothetical protein